MKVKVEVRFRHSLYPIESKVKERFAARCRWCHGQWAGWLYPIPNEHQKIGLCPTSLTGRIRRVFRRLRKW